MGWFESIEHGVTTATDTMQWAWGWAKAPVATAATYAGNTLVYGVDQIVALRNSIPALFTPESKRMVKAATYIAWNQIMPLVALNLANNYVQGMLPQARSSDEVAAWYKTTLTYAGMGAAALIDFGVSMYTYRQGTEILAETMITNTMGPAAFTAHKAEHPEPCEKAKCNFKRRFKGSLREFIILSSNDLLSFAISYTPYIGKPLAFVFSMYANGSLIVRAADITLCERHRAEKPSEAFLATGGIYTAANMALETFLQNTMGPTPFLVQRAIRHILFLLMVNNTAHIKIKQVPLGTGTFAYDPINSYEKITSVITDVFIAGAKSELAPYFRRVPGQPSVISRLLQEGTKLLNNDLEKEIAPRPTFFKQATNKALPRILRSSQNFVHDPVVRIFWPNLQEFLLDIMDIVEAAGMPVYNLTNSSIPVVNKAITKTVRAALPELLFKRYGLAPKLTNFLITLAKDEDFWSFSLALKQWLERHELREKPVLAATSATTLDTALFENEVKLSASTEKQEPTLVLLTSTPPMPRKQAERRGSEPSLVIKPTDGAKATPTSVDTLFSRRNVKTFSVTPANKADAAEATSAQQSNGM